MSSAARPESLRWSAFMAALLAAGMVTACSGSDGPPSTVPATPTALASPTTSPAPGGSASGTPARVKGSPRVEVLASGLEIPWDLAFLPDGRMLVTERPGRVRLVQVNGTVQEKPVATVAVSARGEGGLLGIDLDPEFAQGQPFAYLMATMRQGMQVQRWRVAADGAMTQQAVVLDGIRAGTIHDSGRLRFGPDGHLYVVTGDAGQGALAQDPRSLNGKVLRLSPQQYRATTRSPEVFSLGHRNPQGLDWQPGTGRLVITDHGPSGFDGPSCCDEVNVVVRDGNYGWPRVFGRDHGRFSAPAMLWQRTIAPSGAAFVSRPGSTWTGSYVVAALRGQSLRRLTLSGGRITGEDVLLDGTHGRLRAVVEGPDGALYVTTSNRDGRGQPSAADDRILRIVPPAS